MRQESVTAVTIKTMRINIMSKISTTWIHNEIEKLKDLETATQTMIRRCICWAAAKTHRSEDNIVIGSVNIEQSAVTEYRVVTVVVHYGPEDCTFTLAAKYVGNCYANWMFCESDVLSFRSGLLELFHGYSDLTETEFHTSILDHQAMLHVHFDGIGYPSQLIHSGALIDYLIQVVTRMSESAGRRLGEPAEWCVPMRVDVMSYPNSTDHMCDKLIRFYGAFDTEPMCSFECRYLGEAHRWASVCDMHHVEDDMVRYLVNYQQCGKVWGSDV